MIDYRADFGKVNRILSGCQGFNIHGDRGANISSLGGSPAEGLKPLAQVQNLLKQVR